MVFDHTPFLAGRQPVHISGGPIEAQVRRDGHALRQIGIKSNRVVIQRRFDEASVRELVQRDVERATDIAASENHGVLAEGKLPVDPLSTITVPTLVIHGTADPMFPLEHGQALAEEIPGARLLPLQRAGHGVERADWETIIHAILEHTALGDRARRPS